MADKAGNSKSSGYSELLELAGPASSESITDITAAIAELLVRLEVPEQKRFEIELAVQEALANAVVHGCNGDPSKTIRYKLDDDQHGRVAIIVTDPGPGFQPELLANPKQAKNLYGEHGRGVYLIRELMDEVQFERGGAEIRMWKY